MYKVLLIFKYLGRKLAPMFAALAVMLCTMMVIIVISVMGGFLQQLREAARQLTGDVTVQAASLTGFAHYQELADRLVALPQVDAASPTIRSFGLLNLAGQTTGVQIQGIDPTSFSRIVDYRGTLYWDTPDLVEYVERQYTPQDLKSPILGDYYRQALARARAMDPVGAAMSLTAGEAWHDSPASEEDGEDEGAGAAAPQRRGMVIGIEVNPYHRPDEQGKYHIGVAALRDQATLTAFPLSQSGVIVEPRYQTFIVVNEFKSGLYDVDAGVVFVPFESLQAMLGMQRREVVDYDPQTFEPVGEPRVEPGRATEIVVKGAAGYSDLQVQRAVANAVSVWLQDHPEIYPPSVLTWEQVHATLLGAVKKETGLVTFLFAIISLVAVVMVATTFYMIVLEKTRDIGVLRAIGASRLGILGLFVGYGLAVGVVGATTGLGLAWLQVTSLNALQHFLGNYLGVTAHLLGAAVGGALIGLVVAIVIGFRQRRMCHWIVRLVPLTGALLLAPSIAAVLTIGGYAAWLNRNIRFVMWDPQTYFFSRIPDQVDPTTAGVIVIGAIVSSIIGAIIPALIASSLEPVEALRYE